MLNNIKELIKTISVGGLSGMANLVPGVSAGTILLVTGFTSKIQKSIFTCFENFFALFKKEDERKVGNKIINILKEGFGFLLPFFIGLVVAVILLAELFEKLTPNQINIRNYIFAIFVGFSAASYLWVILKNFQSRYINNKKEESKQNKKGIVVYKAVKLIICILVGYFIVWGFYELKKHNVTLPSNIVDASQITIASFPLILLFGMLAAIAMIFPGLSGALVLLVFGIYGTLTQSIVTFNLLFLVPFVIGVMLGAIIGLYLVNKMVHPDSVFASAVIYGLMIGSEQVIISSAASVWIIVILTTIIWFCFKIWREKHGNIKTARS